MVLFFAQICGQRATGDGIIADASRRLLLEDLGPDFTARLYSIRGHAWEKKEELDRAIASLRDVLIGENIIASCPHQ